MRTGIPVFFTMAGKPATNIFRAKTIPNIVAGQPVNVPNYAVGPNLWPQTNQNPFFNINAFSYPASFTNGNAGLGIGRQGGVWWPEYSLAKSWTYKEKYRMTVRADAHNDFPKTRAFQNPNTVVNITSPADLRQGSSAYRIWLCRLVHAEPEHPGVAAYFSSDAAMLRRSFVKALGVAPLAASDPRFSAFAQQRQRRYDILIKNGELTDPGRKYRQKADLGVVDGKIAAIEPDIPVTQGVDVIDARGLYVHARGLSTCTRTAPTT